MPWLNVPHFKQDEPSWCLPACVAMVAAYGQQPLTQGDIARWLGTTAIGTPASHVYKLEPRGFSVIYRTGSLSELRKWLAEDRPIILFVRTADLPYWKIDTPHSIVMAGIENDIAYLFDPAVDTSPVSVHVDNLMLAWSYSDYTYAIVTPSS